MPADVGVPSAVTGGGSRLVVALGAVIVGILAEAGGASAQIVFAGAMILGIGLPHGASDHLIALGGRSVRSAPGRLAAFLAAYLLVVGLALAAWFAAPGPALTAFLFLSVVHFAIDDISDMPGLKGLGERIARGLMPVTLPAVLHRDELAALFGILSTERSGHTLAGLAAALSPWVIGIAVIALGVRVAARNVERTVELGALVVALIAFTPLVGFSLCFALVHSRGQTLGRMRELRLPTVPSYLLACWPTLAGAATLFAGLAVAYSHGRAPDLRALFIGLSALTVPHMLVTPLFRAKAANPA